MIDQNIKDLCVLIVQYFTFGASAYYAVKSIKQSIEDFFPKRVG